MDYELRAIRPGDKISGFSMGHEAFAPLKTFIKKHAHAYEANSLARTYAFFEAGTTIIQAYITVTCGEVKLAPEDVQHEQPVVYRYSHYPAVKIARLAVPQAMRGNDMGRTMVQFALGIAKDVICPNVGCRFAVVDSKQESVGFYRKCGFTLIDTAENRGRDNPIMFMDLAKITVGD